MIEERAVQLFWSSQTCNYGRDANWIVNRGGLRCCWNTHLFHCQPVDDGRQDVDQIHFQVAPAGLDAKVAIRRKNKYPFVENRGSWIDLLWRACRHTLADNGAPSAVSGTRYCEYNEAANSGWNGDRRRSTHFQEFRAAIQF